MPDKELTLLAKVLPHMFARWRLFEDFEILANLPDGDVEMDVLTGDARHASSGSINLRIASELKAGFASRLALKGIPLDVILEAKVIASVDASKVKTDRARIVHFDFLITSRIRTADGVFEGSQAEDHVWHTREA